MAFTEFVHLLMALIILAAIRELDRWNRGR